MSAVAPHTSHFCTLSIALDIYRSIAALPVDKYNVAHAYLLTGEIIHSRSIKATEAEPRRSKVKKNKSEQVTTCM